MYLYRMIEKEEEEVPTDKAFIIQYVSPEPRSMNSFTVDDEARSGGIIRLRALDLKCHDQTSLS